MEYDFLVYLCALARIFFFKPAIGLEILRNCPDLKTLFSMGRETLLELFNGSQQYASAILDRNLLDWAQSNIDKTLSRGVQIIPITSSLYPERLKQCPDAPLLLYYRGSADLNSRHVLSVVGTRRASTYGRKCCQSIIGQISNNDVKPLIVSGLALGIDECAHLAALEEGLETVAVMPTGMDRIYPACHRGLSERIAERGALVSEFFEGTAPLPKNFAMRNRIIAGMSDALLLVESFIPGGGLISASYANSYSREVFAVPGRMDDPSFRGCNELIRRNMASIVDSESTISKAMGWGVSHSKPVVRSIFSDDDSEEARKILAVLSDRYPHSAEELAERTGLTVPALSSAMVNLELAGRICIECGSKYVLR